jgi:predicted lipoprotein with Yx(FWY)xxD motif
VSTLDEVKADSGAAGALALVTRDDGTKQVSYNGQPLYYYTPDKAAGDTTGQGVGGVWFVAAP